jgi:hypothetical protein
LEDSFPVLVVDDLSHLQYLSELYFVLCLILIMQFIPELLGIKI